MIERTILPDPTDLDGLRRRLADGEGDRGSAGAGGPDRGRRRPIGLGRVRIASNALAELPDDVATVRREGPVGGRAKAARRRCSISRNKLSIREADRSSSWRASS